MLHLTDIDSGVVRVSSLCKKKKKKKEVEYLDIYGYTPMTVVLLPDGSIFQISESGKLFFLSSPR